MTLKIKALLRQHPKLETPKPKELHHHILEVTTLIDRDEMGRDPGYYPTLSFQDNIAMYLRRRMAIIAPNVKVGVIKFPIITNTGQGRKLVARATIHVVSEDMNILWEICDALQTINENDINEYGYATVDDWDREGWDVHGES
jgi:hypothetical protein